MITVDLPLDTDNEDQLLLSWDVEGVILLRNTGKTNLLTLCITVLLDVLLGTLEDDTTLLLLGLYEEVIAVTLD
jgi:hypothetical protein